MRKLALLPLPVGRRRLLCDNSLKYEGLGIDSQMEKGHKEGYIGGANFSPVGGKLRDPNFNGLSPIVYPFGLKSVPLWMSDAPATSRPKRSG